MLPQSHPPTLTTMASRVLSCASRRVPSSHCRNSSILSSSKDMRIPILYNCFHDFSSGSPNKVATSPTIDSPKPAKKKIYQSCRNKRSALEDYSQEIIMTKSYTSRNHAASTEVEPEKANVGQQETIFVHEEAKSSSQTQDSGAPLIEIADQEIEGSCVSPSESMEGKDRKNFVIPESNHKSSDYAHVDDNSMKISEMMEDAMSLKSMGKEGETLRKKFLKMEKKQERILSMHGEMKIRQERMQKLLERIMGNQNGIETRLMQEERMIHLERIESMLELIRTELGQIKDKDAELEKLKELTETCYKKLEEIQDSTRSVHSSVFVGCIGWLCVYCSKRWGLFGLGG